MKKCTDCGIVKPYAEFHKKHGNKENDNSQLVEFAISKHVNTEVSE